MSIFLGKDTLILHKDKGLQSSQSLQSQDNSLTEFKLHTNITEHHSHHKKSFYSNNQQLR